MGQSAHPGRRVLALLAGVAGVIPALTGCATSVAAAATTLGAARDVTVVHSNGTSLAGVAGMRLSPGDVVRTGPEGAADLVTRSRHVYVGSAASLQVVDGAREALRRGAVVVDAQHGPGLRLDVAELTVTAASGSAVRAERSVTIRVGTLVGTAHLASLGGRQLNVSALHQVVTGADALPDTTTPLRLTDDAGEARAVPELVRDDESLNALARGIDGSGASTARVVTASWHVPQAAAPAGVARSERVLPVVIAAAAPADAVRTTYNSSIAYRMAGGSWGVVAHLVGVPAGRVVDELAVLERSTPAGRIGSVSAVLAAIHSPGGAGSTGPSGSGPGSHNGTGNGNGPGNGPGGGPSPSPSPSPSPGSVNQVQNTVTDVLKIVPTPTVTPTGPLPTALTSPLQLPVAP